MTTDPSPIPVPRPRRRWRSPSVRRLMLLVLIIGGLIGWEAARVSRMRGAIAVLRRNPSDPANAPPPGPDQAFTIGGAPDRTEVEFDDERWDGEYPDPPRPEWFHEWLRRAVGVDHFRRVSTLKLSRRPTAEDWAAIGSLGALQELDLGHLDLRDDDLAGLARCPNLRELKLFDSKVGDRALPQVGTLANLRALDLRMTGVTIAGLAPLVRLTRLEELHLSPAGGTDAGLAHLHSLTNLRVLDAQGIDAAVSDAGIAHLRTLTRLEELRLIARGVTDAGVGVLVGLPRLKILDLDSSLQHSQDAFALTPAGVELLGRFPRLEKLKLDAMGAADDAWPRAIARVGMLRKLELSGKRITDAGLVPLGGLTKLEELRLASPEVTDTGLAHLEPLANLARLSFYAGVTPEGAERFRATHPKLEPVQASLWVKEEVRMGADGLLEPPGPPLATPAPPPAIRFVPRP